MVYVAVASPKTLSEDLLKRVASLIGKEIFDTRLLFSGEIPRIVASCHDIDTAESIARGLRDAGLVAFVCKDSELRNHPASFVAHTARSGEREVIFWDRRGGEVRFEAGDAFLIIRGRRQSITQEKTSTTKMKLNVPATVLTGGIPIMRRVTQKTTKESFQAEDFVRIYDGRFSDPRVEMFQNHVDYTFLGPELTPSTPTNFKIVVTKLREWFPLAIFDERLTRHFKTDVSAAGPEEALQINCKLIYLYHLAIGRRGYE
ncbi:MAG: hypothetical protein NTW38_09045 [Candidatus Aminicenantes bacterium]|nr:hypothetical protein [Candidatus Aminicenantes bacterium]